MSSVRLESVSKRYGATTVVDSVNLDIADHEFLVLVGPSGCGKSTTLRMIAGLEELSEGTIHIGARDVTHLEPSDRNIAMVFQNYALYPHKSVFDNLAFGLRMRSVPRGEIESRVRAAAEMLGLTDLLNRRPRQLSGGQMQRVALGRALVRDPEAFLFDEPLSNLDAKMRVQMREEIARLHTETRSSMIYVTHDQVEAMTLGDRICVMHGGRIQQVGRPLEVYEHPANRFVASFIGSPEMNFFSGEVGEGGEFHAPGFSMMLNPGLFDLPRTGSKVVVGVRPEHVSFVAEGSLAATVTMVERLGAQTAVSAQAPSGRIAALTSNDVTARRGETIHLAIDTSRVHLFDAESGLSLAKKTGSR
jgi:multiple sugar transport system ATP-binding protein